MEKLEREKEEEEISWKERNLGKGKGREREMLFPELGGAAGGMGPGISEMARKRMEVDKALGRGKNKEGLGNLIQQETKKNKVISLNLKTHKITFGNEKKKVKKSKGGKEEVKIEGSTSNSNPTLTNEKIKSDSLEIKENLPELSKSTNSSSSEESSEEEEESLQPPRFLDEEDDSFEILHALPGRKGLKLKEESQNHERGKELIKRFERPWLNPNLLPEVLPSEDYDLTSLPSYLAKDQRSRLVNWSKEALIEAEILEVESKGEADKVRIVPGMAEGSTVADGTNSKLEKGGKKNIPGAGVEKERGSGKSGKRGGKSQKGKGKEK